MLDLLGLAIAGWLLGYGTRGLVETIGNLRDIRTIAESRIDRVENDETLYKPEDILDARMHVNLIRDDMRKSRWMEIIHGLVNYGSPTLIGSLLGAYLFLKTLV